MINQNQVRNLTVPTVSAAALVGRPNEVAHIKTLDGWFRYDTAALTADGVNVVVALGGFWVRVQAATKDNTAAIVAPSITDDSSAGYAIGSKWIDTVANKAYMAIDVTIGAAIWNQIDQTLVAGVTSTLDYVFLWDSTASFTANVAFPLPAFNVVDDAAGLVSAAGITVAKTGRYEIIVKTGTAASGVGTSTVRILVDGVVISHMTTAGIATSNEVPNGVMYQAQITAGQVITFNTNSTPVFGNVQISLKQLPVETVVPAGSAKANFTAIVAPVVANDSSQGYAIGSSWVDSVANKSYIAVDVTVGAAVWNQIDNSTVVAAKHYWSGYQQAAYATGNMPIAASTKSSVGVTSNATSILITKAGVYTAQVSATASAAGATFLYINKNAVTQGIRLITVLNSEVSVSATFPCIAGDTVEFRSGQSTSDFAATLTQL